MTIARLARVTRLVEPHDDVAGLDLVAVAHAHLADDAAGRVLHLLDVGIDDDLPGAITRAGRSASVAAQPPTPPASSSTTTRGRATRCRRIERRALVDASLAS